MYGEVEGDAPHDDQPELEPLHLPGDGPAAPRGRPVLTNTISYSGTMENFLKFNVILLYKQRTNRAPLLTGLDNSLFCIPP